MAAKPKPKAKNNDRSGLLDRLTSTCHHHLRADCKIRSCCNSRTTLHPRAMLSLQSLKDWNNSFWLRCRKMRVFASCMPLKVNFAAMWGRHTSHKPLPTAKKMPKRSGAIFAALYNKSHAPHQARSLWPQNDTKCTVQSKLHTWFYWLPISTICENLTFNLNQSLSWNPHPDSLVDEASGDRRATT